MPFTLAHPAAVWPLKYVRFLAVIPLVIGSLMPDLASYVPNSHELINTHSVRGTFVIDLPLGYALLMFLVLFRKLLVAPLWDPHRHFLTSAFDELISQKFWWVLIIPSLLIGSWTHIVWDSFTHENHFMVRKLPMLQYVVPVETDHPLRLYRLLQYGCSVVGIMIVAWWYWHALHSANQQATANASPKKYTLLGLILISLLTGLGNALETVPGFHAVYWFISVTLTTAMPVFAGLYLLMAAVFYWRERSARPG
ncbi:MAG TPA: DUF4184 family protein [Steroidobacteraceae bacterium]|nr:DUF4184 family protein [Steroidobacteraceae bacterium]